MDQASVSLRPPKGYYGNFGENDNEYVDQNDFSSENGNNQATDISIDDDEMSLGDTMLHNNINKQIEFLHEDDIKLDQFAANTDPENMWQTKRERQGKR